MTQKKRKGGLRPALYGVLVGLLLGLGLLLLKSLVSSELIALLDDEASSACAGCSFEVDSVEISLISLHAIAKGARLKKDGEVALRFERVEAKFSLQYIWDKKIDLTQIHLMDGNSRGVLPGSPTFDFVDHLAAPSPESQNKDKIKIRLLRLILSGASFSEDFDTGTLYGTGVGLDMVRNADDDFELRPQIGELEFELSGEEGSNSPPKRLKLGNLRSSALITDDLIDFRENVMSLKRAGASAAFEVKNDPTLAMNGELGFHIDARSLDFPDWISCSLEGRGEMLGTLDVPTFRGSFQHRDDGKGAEIIFDPVRVLGLETISGNYELSVLPKGTEFSITSIKGEGDGFRLKQQSPLSYADGILTGALQVTADEIFLDSAVAKNVSAQIEFEGSLRSIVTRISGETRQLVIGNNLVSNLNFKLEAQDDLLKFDVSRDGKDGHGSLRTTGEMDFSNEDPHLSPTTVELSHLKLFSVSEVEEDGDALFIELSGRGEFAGKTTLESMSGEASIQIASPEFSGEAALQGVASVKQGTLHLEVKNESGSIAADSQMNFLGDPEGSLSVIFSNFKASEYDPEIECFNTTTSLLYRFDPSAVLSGSGSLRVDSLQFGCEPYTLRLAKPVSLAISDGSLHLDGTRLTGKETELELSGLVSLHSDIEARATGKVFLEALVSFIPDVDDLRGTVEASLLLSGTLKEPKLTGIAEISGGEIAVESASILAREMNGKVSLVRDRLEISGLKGRLNGGTFQVEGTILPLDFRSSQVEISFDQIFLEPIQNTNLVFSGQATLSAGESSSALLSGNIDILSAEFSRDFDLVTFLREIPSFIFTRSSDTEGTSNTPDIELDMLIGASRNVFFLTPFLSTEIQGDLRLKGTVANPSVEGELQTLTGWLGFKERRFEINSGRLLFRSGSSQPQVEILSESVVRTRAGDTILIILEATGPLDSPKITLSSDRALSQRELLALATSRASIGDDTFRSDSNSGLDFRGISSNDRRSGIRGLLQDLTTIDSLSIEPVFNSRRGVVEPSLVARKNIWGDLNAQGLSFLSDGDASFLLRYDLNRVLTLTGSAESATTEDETNLGIDLGYTILASSIPYLRTEIRGNKEVGRTKLLSAVRLSENSRVRPSDTENVGVAVERHYNDLGFRSAAVEAECILVEHYCRRLVINVDEGTQHRVRSVSLIGDLSEDILAPQSFEDDYRDKIANSATLQQATIQALNQLRSEGYIASRVSAEFRSMPDSQSDVILELSVFTGEPVTFHFVGNKAFSAGEFLATINLFSRTQPFGPNTVNILLRNIERLYREAGYLYATFDLSEETDETTSRVVYTIRIQEEQPIEVEEVRFVGLEKLSREQLLSLVGEYQDSSYTHRLLHPEFAVAEEIEAHAELMRQIYEEEGFRGTQVSYRIVDFNETSVNVEYLFREGTDFKADWIEIVGLPGDVKAPALPKAPYSIPKANRYLGELFITLEESGYHSASAWSELGEESQHMEVHIEPGTRTEITSITVAGHNEVSEELIREQFGIRSGDAWDQIEIRDARKRLLTLGLFSRVDVTPLDGELDEEEEALLIRVNEKPMQTLQIGGGASSEFGLHLFGEATDKSLFEDGRSLALRFDTYFGEESPDNIDITRGVASLRYWNPALMGSSWVHSEDLRFQRLDLSNFEFDLDRLSLASNFFRTDQNRITYSVGHTILQEDLSDVSPGAILSELDTGTVDLSFLKLSFSVDQRDDQLTPRDGYNMNLDYSVALDAIGSDANYHAVDLRGSFLYPLFDRRSPFTFAAASGVASAWTLHDTSEIPITQRYYLGGRNSIRGFRENSLGPRGDDGSVIGGDFSVNNNIELRYQFLDSASVLTFYDFGSVFLRERGIDSSGLRESAGVGIRYLSPIGPIGFDIGHPLDERPGEPSVRLHFVIGNTF